MESSLKQKAGRLATRENLIYLLFISTYLHYIATAVVLVVAMVMIIRDKVARSQLFVHPGSRWLPAFSAAALLMALIRGNWLGAACAVGFFAIMLVSLWVRSAIRRGVMERALSYCSAISCILAPCAAIEFFFFPPWDFRVKLWFFNSNYLAFMSLIAFAISIYKLLNGKGHIWIYIVSVCCNLTTMYICSSIFIWIDAFVVVAMLLLLFKKWPTIALFLAVLAAIGIALYFSPELLPRYYAIDDSTGQRFSIWPAALDAIKKSPFIGYGFLGFNLIHGNYPEAFPAPHTHNTLLELMLDFGFIGAALLLPFFVCYFKNLKRCYEYSVARNTTNLILALTVAMSIHGFTDIVYLWLQTGTLLALILAGLGMDEKLLKRAQAKPTPQADGPEPAPRA